MTVPRFVAQASAGESLAAFGTAEQLCCFCHVLGVAPALVALAAGDDATGRAVNIVRWEPVGIAGLAEPVVARTGSSSTIRRRTHEQVHRMEYQDRQRRVPDCALAERLRGFRPTGDLDDVLDAVVADHLSHHPAVP